MSDKIKQYENEALINASAESVFAFMDNIENSGMHMTKNNAAMMGSKLKIEWLTENKTGVGATYRWNGSVLGMKMDFTVVVDQWEKDKSKTWGTKGEAKMIVIDWFEMYLKLIPKDHQTQAILGIKYTVPKRNLIGFLLGRPYSKWCVNSMLKDTQKHFQ